MDKSQRRVESVRWGLVLGCVGLVLVGIILSGHEIWGSTGFLLAATAAVWLLLHRWRSRRFTRLMNGEERIAEWIDEDDRVVCFGKHAVFANGRFICWRGEPRSLQRAEYNSKRGVFKFVLHYPSGGIMPWRSKFSAKITVPPDAVEAAEAAEQYFSTWAKNHRRHSVDPAPPTEEIDS